jgi:hypothetical protein
VGLTPNSRSNLSLYALSLIFSKILKGPSAQDISLDFLRSGNRYFLKCNQTKYHGSNFTSFCPLLPATQYFAFIFPMFNLVVSCILRINSDHQEASKHVVSKGCKGNKSIGAQGLKPYMTWNGLTFIMECTDLLKANSICGKHSSQNLRLDFKTPHNIVDNVRLPPWFDHQFVHDM